MVAAQVNVNERTAQCLNEFDAKAALRGHELLVPAGIIRDDPYKLANQAAQLTAPLALKGKAFCIKANMATSY